jgi:hypothetical protein
MEGAVDGSICLRNVEGLCNGEGSATMRKVELTSIIRVTYVWCLVSSASFQNINSVIASL